MPKDSFTRLLLTSLAISPKSDVSAYLLPYALVRDAGAEHELAKRRDRRGKSAGRHAAREIVAVLGRDARRCRVRLRQIERRVAAGEPVDDVRTFVLGH